MRSLGSRSCTRTSISLSSGRPGTMACLPESRAEVARARSCKASPPLAFPGPWQERQAFARMGATSRSKSTPAGGPFPAAASSVAITQKSGKATSTCVLLLDHVLSMVQSNSMRGWRPTTENGAGPDIRVAMSARSSVPARSGGGSVDAVDSAVYSPSVDRALEILEHIGEAPDGLGLSELSARLGFPKNA